MDLDSILEAGLRGAIGGAIIYIGYSIYKYLKPKVKKAGSIAKEKNNQGLNLGKFNFAISDLIILILVIVAVIFLLIMN